MENNKKTPQAHKGIPTKFDWIMRANANKLNVDMGNPLIQTRRFLIEVSSLPYRLPSWPFAMQSYDPGKKSHVPGSCICTAPKYLPTKQPKRSETSPSSFSSEYCVIYDCPYPRLVKSSQICKPQILQENAKSRGEQLSGSHPCSHIAQPPYGYSPPLKGRALPRVHINKVQMVFLQTA